MKWRFSESERVLRSVGDAPNGLVGCGRMPGGFRFFVNPTMPPQDVPTRGTQVIKDQDFDRLVEEQGITFVEIDEALDACGANARTLLCVWAVAEQGTIPIIVQSIAGRRFDVARGGIAFLEEIHDGIRRRLA